jgi:hypothetical protein
LSADTIKIACPISPATDSTLPQSDIDSIRGPVCGSLRNLILNLELQCLLRAVLNKTFGPICTLTSTTIDCSLLFYTLVLSKNMHHMSIVT